MGPALLSPILDYYYCTIISGHELVFSLEINVMLFHNAPSVRVLFHNAPFVRVLLSQCALCEGPFLTAGTWPGAASPVESGGAPRLWKPAGLEPLGSRVVRMVQPPAAWSGLE